MYITKQYEKHRRSNPNMFVQEPRPDPALTDPSTVCLRLPDAGRAPSNPFGPFP